MIDPKIDVERFRKWAENITPAPSAEIFKSPGVIMNERIEFEACKPDVFFKPEWGVYRKHGETSICYTSTKEVAETVAAALEYFANCSKGKEHFATVTKTRNSENGKA